MTEKLLQYLWQYRFYDARNLQTLDGQSIRVLQPGLHNTNQGPDFLHARLFINDTLWIGHVELHVHSTEWVQHGHTGDPHYANVILHVVWKHDADIRVPFPTLELDGRISGWLLQQYAQFMNSGSFIPCEPQIASVKPLIIRQMLDRAAAERIQSHAKRFNGWLAASGQNREQTFWRAMCRNFGYPVNQDLFEAVFQSVPFSFLLRHRHNRKTLEAIFLGQAGLLPKREGDEYDQLLHQLFQFRKQQLGLPEISIQPAYFRLRPASFPEIRLGQFVALFSAGFPWKKPDLPFAKWMEMLQSTNHPGKQPDPESNTAVKAKKIGKQLAASIFINTLIPAWAAAEMEAKPNDGLSVFLEKLSQCPPEQNQIIQRFARLQLPVEHALDTQGWLEIKKSYCDARRCLECSIGRSILKKTNQPDHAQ